MVRIALFQPDIPQNTASIFRLSACFGVGVDIIEPCGFLFDDKRFKRVVMDYLPLVEIKRHQNWDTFQQTYQQKRIVLFTTKATKSYTKFQYQPNDILLFGQESCGVPEAVHKVVDERLNIPIITQARSLNLALSCALAVGEATRQLQEV